MNHMISIRRPDLELLVKTALAHREITLDRAGELLALSLKDMQALADKWGIEKEGS